MNIFKRIWDKDKRFFKRLFSHNKNNRIKKVSESKYAKKHYEVGYYSKD